MYIVTINQYTLSKSVPWYKMSWIACMLKLSSTFVYGHNAMCTDITTITSLSNSAIFNIVESWRRYKYDTIYHILVNRYMKKGTAEK